MAANFDAAFNFDDPTTGFDGDSTLVAVNAGCATGTGAANDATTTGPVVIVPTGGDVLPARPRPRRQPAKRPVRVPEYVRAYATTAAGTARAHDPQILVRPNLTDDELLLLLV